MLSLVVPVYRNEESVSELVARLERLAVELPDELEAVVVVDGSPDGSLERLREELVRLPIVTRLLSLSRNFGSFAAIRAGLAAGSGDRFAIMSADLQEPPELILEMDAKLRDSEVQVVVGSRAGRDDPWVDRVASSVFWWLYRRLVQPEVPRGGVDVFACTRRFRDEILRLEETNSTLVGLVFWLGFRRAEVAYRRLPRRHGRSQWSLKRKVQYLRDSAFAFSDLPLRLLTLLGAGGVGLSVVLATVVLIARMQGAIAVPGYTATVLVVMFFGGLNCLGIGLLGEYVWRTFENSKRRPLLVVAETWVLGRSSRKEGE